MAYCSIATLGFTLKGGDELNVAVDLALLGVKCKWISLSDANWLAKTVCNVFCLSFNFVYFRQNRASRNTKSLKATMAKSGVAKQSDPGCHHTQDGLIDTSSLHIVESSPIRISSTRCCAQRSFGPSSDELSGVVPVAWNHWTLRRGGRPWHLHCVARAQNGSLPEDWELEHGTCWTRFWRQKLNAVKNYVELMGATLKVQPKLNETHPKHLFFKWELQQWIV